MKDSNRRISYSATIEILVVILFVSMTVSIVIGRYPINIKELGGMIASKFIEIEPFWSKTQEALFWNHRFPRIILACLVGASLSCAGSAYQGVFQNPMSAPDILGASSGAAFGASVAIILGMGNTMIVVFAFVFSLLTVAIVIFMGNHAKGNRVLGLILAGIVISSLMSSGTSFIKLMADPNEELPQITYWLMGSLNGTRQEDVLFAMVPMAIGLIPLFLLRWRINLLTLGDDEAKTMGINVKQLRTIVIVASTLVTAASVAVSGTIGWVGLVIPHMARRLAGNNYKHLMPASLLCGAIFLLWVDNISRNAFTTEIPLGILTSVIGAPFFIYLITKEEV